MTSLSVIIPVLNDRWELTETVRSLRSTGFKGEIIVIDDRSLETEVVLPSQEYRLVRNDARMGVAKSRHLGAELAQSDWILFLDSHMRMGEKWLSEFEKLAGLDRTLINGTCLGLWGQNRDLGKFEGEYRGVTLRVLNRAEQQILEGKWSTPAGDLGEIPCCMGAIYFIPRLYFLELGGLKALHSWGSDEPYLSMKVWMSGGRVVQSYGIRAGHWFRDNAPYATPNFHMLYNKMRMVRELVDNNKVSLVLQSLLASNDQIKFANDWLKRDQHEIAKAKLAFDARRKMSFLDFCQKFALDLTDVENFVCQVA